MDFWIIFLEGGAKELSILAVPDDSAGRRKPCQSAKIGYDRYHHILKRTANMRLPYLPPIPFMPPSMPVWLSYLLIFAAAVIILLVIVKIFFRFANSGSGAMLAILLIVLFLILVFLLVTNFGTISGGIQRFFGPIF